MRPAWGGDHGRWLRNRGQPLSSLLSVEQRVGGPALDHVRGFAHETPRTLPGNPAMTVQTRLKPPFRAEHIGSFLRPTRLIEAARAHKAGKLDDAGFARVQDECV